MSNQTKRIPLGQINMSCTVHEHMDPMHPFFNFVFGCIRRHRHHEWGDIVDADREMNDYAAEHGGRIVSAYTFHKGVVVPGQSRIWIITDSDRQNTTVLFPSDY